ncbi:MAG: (2Fe-2S)-binding protein [Chitinophagales bacterium]|nr:(2Fe-2S)-binding protein [Hyphomicrobiales bacterium]
MIRMTVNGREKIVSAEADTPLLWVLRDEIGLTGTKYGCGVQQCGACRVHIDGELTPSCGVFVGDMEGKSIITIEGLTGKVANAVVAAWDKHQVVQCGYCQSGQIMAATALLTKNPKPTDAEIDLDENMGRNVCRCATYHRIRAAIHDAAKTLEG